MAENQDMALCPHTLEGYGHAAALPVALSGRAMVYSTRLGELAAAGSKAALGFALKLPGKY